MEQTNDMFDTQNLKNTQQSLENTTATFKSKIIVFPTVCRVMVHSQSQQKEKNIAVCAILGGEERQNKSGTITDRKEDQRPQYLHKTKYWKNARRKINAACLSYCRQHLK